MFLPLKDENRPGALVPVVTWSLIAANVFIFILQVQNPEITYKFSMVPHEIITGTDITQPVDLARLTPGFGPLGETQGIIIPHAPTPISVYITLFTSMFLHGSLLHLLGNMLFLWIFGDNLEDALGRIRYLIFYILSGLIADVAHILVSLEPPARYIPTLGASGAISGVLGGYIYLFPRSQVTGILFRILVTLPAAYALGIWFVFQLIMAIFDQGGGVAYMAHIGGFVGGLLLVILMGVRQDFMGTYSAFYGVTPGRRSWSGRLPGHFPNRYSRSGFGR
ncbi:MAG: rhomboid family intramembrane serine protease [Gemmatales bacterium]|nr:rhomboid family intramembrane serine protease [Gemmatales bacterium]MDW7993414.1 rhomboid family intramembrane serine protease [Gemmatales bacterium]